VQEPRYQRVVRLAYELLLVTTLSPLGLLIHCELAITYLRELGPEPRVTPTLDNEYGENLVVE
jgi:hypothetical protein